MIVTATVPAAPPVAIPDTTISIDLVAVPGGTIELDGTAHDVRPFLMSRTEITWDAFDIFLYRLDEPASGDGGADATARPSKPYISMDRGFGHAGHPAISMSHKSAAAFCAWLSRVTGRTFRLPTEAEWRHACALGAGDAPIESIAWCRANADHRTHTVGTRAADALGLHDLRGNAAEWATTVAGGPVVLGGSYRDDADDVGCAARAEPTPDWNASDPQIPRSVWWLADAGFVGFRVVCEASLEVRPDTP